MTFKKTIIATALTLIASTAYADSFGPDQQLMQLDPLTVQQWHLKNTGQTGFSHSGGIAGQDLNLDFSSLMGIKGRGITVAVIDSGVQIDHPDLVTNVVPGSVNLVDGSDFPTDFNGHGTSVAGLIAATEGNGIGGRGVAPLANLVGFNFLDSQSLSSWLVSHGLSEDFAALDRFTDPRVFNQSYGSTPPIPVNGDITNNPTLALQEQVMEDISLNSHWGRGALYVKSAGNSYQSYNAVYAGLPILVLPYENNTFFDNQGLPFHNANITSDNTSFWNVVISALNANGELASYSSVGANVLLSAPGGEFGTAAPAMVTVDLSGCDRGGNSTATPSENTLHGGSDLDPNCDYLGTMNGTSSAAPNTAGAIATVMSANPALDARTVKHILATTARKTDADHPGVDLQFENIHGEQVTYNAIPAWQTNNAGYAFHNHYGLGAVNVDEAVYKALFTSASLPELQITDWQQQVADVEIPDATVAGAQSTMHIVSDLTVEAVQVKLNIDHQRIRDLGIELISPAGTRSVLMSARTGFLAENNGGHTDSVMLSNHFYGENAQGDWTLKVIDTDKGTSQSLIFNSQIGIIGFKGQNNSVNGVIKDWSMRIYGH
ncbi:S8 family serine peptidase [Pseudoalteromonas shioyasakiensis]|uniref:S8 family peptidase n=1 Tax=Pseudoalteromonas shioyasakiensis TaxID=1190813 RepID=UPI002119419C|nr:S8 family peptidase [Pseudoalteromonas shioyasakiensis]MCQ8878578.1 S8 family serine peptidase [Pseudoalteromonas shioyasakiensis]